MSRTKGGIKNARRRRNILGQAKGYRFARSKKKRAAIEALHHAGRYAFRDRKAKKRSMRGLSIVRINAALRENGFRNYSSFIGALKKKNIELDRKVLAEIAEQYPETFKRIIAKVS